MRRLPLRRGLGASGFVHAVRGLADQSFEVKVRLGTLAP